MPAVLLTRLSHHLRAELTRAVRHQLRHRATLLVAARADADAARVSLQQFERALPRVVASRDSGPFTAQTTVHAAWLRHPGVAAVFARRGLTRCLDCAVGEDETLGEAALGEGFLGETLLSELNGLLHPAPRAVSP